VLPGSAERPSELLAAAPESVFDLSCSKRSARLRGVGFSVVVGAYASAEPAPPSLVAVACTGAAGRRSGCAPKSRPPSGLGRRGRVLTAATDSPHRWPLKLLTGGHQFSPMGGHRISPRVSCPGRPYSSPCLVLHGLVLAFAADPWPFGVVLGHRVAALAHERVPYSVRMDTLQPRSQPASRAPAERARAL